MHIVVECYGASQRWCGSRRLALELPAAACVGDALDWLAQQYPELAAHRSGLAVAMGDSIVEVERALADGGTLALIPPVSAG
jgi:molybdopterin converting factor small subunit